MNKKLMIIALLVNNAFLIATPEKELEATVIATLTKMRQERTCSRCKRIFPTQAAKRKHLQQMLPCGQF